MNANPSQTACSTPQSKVICLRPRPTLPLLPAIDQADVLVAGEGLPVPDELVHGLLHRATKGVLAGASKAGKTWLLMDLAMSVATGAPFLRWPTTRGRVLYVNLEIARSFFAQRLHTLQQRKGLGTIDNLDVWSLRGQFRDAETLLVAVGERARKADYSLIVLDPIYKLMVGRAENASTGVGVLCQEIERLVVETGAAVVYAHHFTKGDQSCKKAMDRLSGSGVFARDADTIITFTEHVAEACFAVEVTLRNMPPADPFVVEWNYPVMVLRADLDPAGLRTGKRNPPDNTLEFVLSLVREQPLTTTEWQELAEKSGVSRATFFRIRSRLEASGEVVPDPQSSTHWTIPGRDVSRRSHAVSHETETSETPSRPVVLPDDPAPKILIPSEPTPPPPPTPSTRPEPEVAHLCCS